MKRWGWLIIALFAFQSVVLGAMTACRLAPMGYEEIGFSAVGGLGCDREAGADRAPLKPHLPAQPCCISCAAAGSCDAVSHAPAKAEAAIIEWPRLPTFLTHSPRWADVILRHPVGWSTAWSSRAPPHLS